MRDAGHVKLFYRNCGAGTADPGRAEKYGMHPAGIGKAAPYVKFPAVRNGNGIGEMRRDLLDSAGISRQYRKFPADFFGIEPEMV